MRRKNNGSRLALRQNLIDCFHSGQARNIHHLRTAGKNAPEKDYRSQCILMEDGYTRSRADSEPLQTCCNLPALQVQIAEVDTLFRKDQSGLPLEARCCFG